MVRKPIDEEWLRRNILTHRPIAIMCGAGISRHSGLPIVTDFVPAILRELEAPATLAERVPELPFEVLMRVLARHSRIDPLLSIFGAGRANTNHNFLAHALRRCVVTDVLTTNFDCLIEQAYSDLDIHSTSPLAVLRTAQDLREEDWTNSRPRLTKIHGCSSDPREMAITIEQVAGGIYSQPRAAALEYLFATGKHSIVLVFGYSCSDTWDLSPQIEALASRAKPVYFIEHMSSLQQRFELEEMRERRSKNPFRAYPQAYRIYADTDCVVRFLWQELVDDKKYRAPEKQETQWLSAVQAWAHTLPPANTVLIRGHLMSLLNMPGESVLEFQKLSSVDGGEIAVGLGNQVGSLLEIGDAEQAAQICATAVAVFRKSGTAEQLGNQLGWLGNCMNQLKKPEEALKHFREAAAILKSIGDSAGLGNQLGNIGNALSLLGRYEEAVVAYKRSLAIADKIGNVSGTINQLIGLSETLIALGKPVDALDYSRRGEKVAHAFKSRKKHAHLASLSGKACLTLGAYSETLEHWEDGIAIAREEADEEFLATYLIEAARAFYKLGLWSAVLRNAREAESLRSKGQDSECQFLIALAQTKSGQVADAESRLEAVLNDPLVIDNPENIVSLLQALGDLHINRSDPGKALNYLTRALSLVEEHAMKDVRSAITASVGHALLIANSFEDARPHLDFALECARQAGNLPDQGHCHQLLALYYQHVGRLEEARRHAQFALEIAEATENSELIVWTLADLGSIDLLNGAWDDAFKEFRAGMRLSQSLNLPTGILSYRRYLGRLLRLVGMEEYALAELSEAREILVNIFGPHDPDLPALDSEIRRALQQLADYEPKSFFQTWHRKSPLTPQPGVLENGPTFYEGLREFDDVPLNLAFYWGRFLYRYKQYAKAILVLSGCQPGDHEVEVANFLGNLHYVSKQPREALLQYAKVLSMDPGHQNASFMGGLCCKDLGEISQADRYYAQVTPAHPSYEDAVFNRGLCASEMQDPESARKHFEAFVEINDSDSEAWTALAFASGAAGHLVRAKFAIKKALELGADPMKLNDFSDAIDESLGERRRNS